LKIAAAIGWLAAGLCIHVLLSGKARAGSLRVGLFMPAMLPALHPKDTHQRTIPPARAARLLLGNASKSPDFAKI